MAEEIRQQMGFDAAKALETLARLNKAFDSFGTRVDSLADKFGKFNVGSRTTETATAKLASAFNTNMSSSEQSVARLTTSVQLMSRIVFTQFIIRQLRILRSTFQDTAEEAAAFQRRVAEIQTIASGQNFGQIAQQVRAISDSLNVPLLESASGVYQALSNSVGNFNDSIRLTESAARFAKATNSTLAQSVDLLSAAINSYGLSVDDADRLAGGFFETIRQGRVTAAELSNTFGRVAPRAAALGISLEEVNAALATSTTTGLKNAEAVTLLNGIITGMTKPTEQMSAALKQFGFSSAEAAVQTLGLPKLLQSLVDSTDGTSASLAKLFPNIRGMGGAVALTGDRLATFAQNIEDSRKAGAAFAREKFLTATATDAERFTSEINKLKNALTVDLGQGLLKAAADTAQFVGGADNVIASVKAVTPVVIGTSAALLGYAASSRAAASASALLATRLGPLSAALFAIGAASSAAQVVDRVFFSTPNGLRQLDEATKKSLDTFKKAETEKVDAFARANEERTQIALQTVAALNRTYLQDKDNLIGANDALLENTKSRVRDIIAVRERLVSELARTAAGAQQFIGESQIRVSDLQQGRSDQRFDQSISRLSDAQQVLALTDRAARQARVASDALLAAGQAGDQQGLQRALAQFDAAEDLNRRAAETAAKTGDRRLELAAAAQLEQLDRRRIAAERQLQNLQNQRVAQLDKERAAQQAIVDRTRAAGKLLLENLNQFDGDKQLPAAQLAERQANRQKALAELQDVALSSKDLDIASVLGLANFVSRFENELKRDPINLAINVQDETARIQAHLTQAFDRFSVKLGFDVTALEQVLQRKFSTPDEVSQGLIDARNRAKEIEQQIADSTTERRSLGALRSQVDVVAQIISDLEDKLRADRTNVGKTFRAFAADFRTVSRQAEITQADVRRLVDELQSVDKASQGFFGVGKVILPNLPEIATGLLKLQELQQQRTRLIEVPAGSLDELNRIKAVIESINPTSFQSAATSISHGAASAERIAVSFERAAIAAGRLGIQPTIGTQAPRHVETMTQQLGSTSTVNLGDIIVNAAPGASGEVLGRQIAAELNRALRRGSVALKV